MTTSDSDIHTLVREHYGKTAAQAKEQKSSCCGSTAAPARQEKSCCGSTQEASFSPVEKMYESAEVGELPQDVTGFSLGCGDPVTLASLLPGQTVLDLGSGGGLDCFLAARKVGAAGHVIGVDMTAEMLERARANKAKMGVENVEFRLGEIEHLPVADASVDVIISNCVINLSPDKPQVFREAFRALKPGGRLAVSDIVTDGPLPEKIKQDLSAWAGCVAGAWEAKDYTAAIAAAGFVEIGLTPVYFDKETIQSAVTELNLSGVDAGDDSMQKAIYSAKVTARKPV